MFLEILNHAFIDSSFVYLYFGILFISLGAMYIIKMQSNRSMMGSSFFVEKHQTMKVNLDDLEKPLAVNESLRTWLILTFQRKDEKDGKEDDLSSYFKNNFKIRGGQLWKETAYARSLKNITFLSSSSYLY